MMTYTYRRMVATRQEVLDVAREIIAEGTWPGGEAAVFAHLLMLGNDRSLTIEVVELRREIFSRLIANQSAQTISVELQPGASGDVSIEYWSEDEPVADEA